MSDPTTPLTDDQSRCLEAIGALEDEHGRPATLEEVAERFGSDPIRTRQVISGLLSDGAGLVRELEADEPDETAYSVRTRT